MREEEQRGVRAAFHATGVSGWLPLLRRRPLRLASSSLADDTRNEAIDR
jgi:hypothetical protein